MKTVTLIGPCYKNEKCYYCGCKAEFHFTFDYTDSFTGCSKCIHCPGVGRVCDVMKTHTRHDIAGMIKCIRSTPGVQFQNIANELFIHFVEYFDLSDDSIKEFAEECEYPIATNVALIRR